MEYLRYTKEFSAIVRKDVYVDCPVAGLLNH